MDNLIKVKVNSILDIDPQKRFLIEDLTIKGTFYSRDELPILRSMCNSLDENGKRTGGNLSYIDLSQCRIKQDENGNSNVWNGDGKGLKNCISLKKIIFPSTASFSRVSGGECFTGCKSLESIIISGYVEPRTNPHLYDKDGVLFTLEDGKSYLLKYPANKGTEYQIPNVTYIADYAFEDSHLTRLYMPAIPPSCNEKAFNGVNRATMTLVVPKGSYDSYWLHTVYGKFRIEELDD